MSSLLYWFFLIVIITEIEKSVAEKTKKTKNKPDSFLYISLPEILID